jgi:hypothetical protein
MMLRARMLTVVILMIAAISSVALADEQAAPAKEKGTAAEEEAVPAGISFETPILVTSAGQSVDIKLAGVLLKRLGIEYDSNPRATSDDLEGIKTLIVVPGYSSKGLGAAGISRDDEMERVEALLAGAAEADIPVLALHLGGNARRGAQSDDFNARVVRASEMAIVVAQGDEDGFFTEISKEDGIPLTIVEMIADAMKPLEEIIEQDEDAKEQAEKADAERE